MDKPLRGKALAKALEEPVEWFFKDPWIRGYFTRTRGKQPVSLHRFLTSCGTCGPNFERRARAELEAVGLKYDTMTINELDELCKEPDDARKEEIIDGLCRGARVVSVGPGEYEAICRSTTIPPTVTLTLTVEQLVSMLAKAVVQELVRISDEDDAE